MASAGDVRDIMGLSGGPEITKEMIMGRGGSKKKKKKKKRSECPSGPGGELKKRPEGMARELYNLLYGGSDSKDAPPLISSDTLSGGPDIGYKRLKAKLGLRKVRPWIWMKFVNPARNDGLILRHWRRATDEGKDYPFARFNKKLEIPMYTDLEYQNHLSSEGEDGKGWSRSETDHLFDLCRRFDLRFTVIHDRYSRNNAAAFPQRSIEDLKERYYNVTEKLESIRLDSSSSSSRIYDADHERRRKEQLIRLYNRTPEQIEEEEMLKSELKKIENRKREREKKAQDLQKLLDHAEASVTPKPEKKSQSLGGSSSGGSSSKKKSVSGNSSSCTTPRSSSSKPDVSSALDASAGIKFPESNSKGPAIYLRSSRMKLPPSVGQKKTKAIETMLTEIPGMEMNPMPTEEISGEFNDLRSDMVLLYELKNALVICESELTSIKAQYEGLAPNNKTLEIPEKLKNYFNNKEKTKNISDVIDVVGNGGTPPVRKRKAALEQSNVLKKIKNKNF